MPMPDGFVPLPPVSTTAVGVAAVRAAESAQPLPLFVDPLAPVFVRAAQTFWTVDRDEPADRRRVGALIFWIRARTRFLDDVIARASAEGCRQFVVLGAGLDARAFRLPLPPDARFFEVDLPGVLEFKERVVRDNNFTPECERIVVPTDLAGAWTTDLDRAGFDPAPRTTWLAEGLLPYLKEGTREAVIDALTQRSVPGSHFGLTLARADRRAVTPRDPDALPSRPGDYVALWQSDAPPDAHVWLGERGWSVEQYDAVERGAAYGLEVPAARQEHAGDRARLVDARRF
jgi:N-methyltransferase